MAGRRRHERSRSNVRLHQLSSRRRTKPLAVLSLIVVGFVMSLDSCLVMMCCVQIMRVREL